mgnify:CR=1 FL=1|jgi:AAA+ ATPase superfamily predicted ATPase
MNIEENVKDILLESDKYIADTFIEPNISLLRREKELSELRKILSESTNHVVLITGVAGIGKSTLVRMYAEENKEQYSNVYIWYAWQLSKDLKVENNSLIIVDDADELDSKKLEEIIRYNESSFILVVGRTVDYHFSKEKYVRLSVNGLNQSEIVSFRMNKLKNHIVDFDYEEMKRILLLTQGNPLIIENMLRLIDSLGIDVVDKLLYQQISVGKSDIVVPNKNIISPSLISIKKDVLQINEDLMRYIAQEPMSMHELSPREFEKIIAELFKKLGYEVELTKQTRDGGVDIYIAEKTDLGKFLFLVECKHYAPNRPVGIEVIRNMYGVLGMNKRKPTGGIIATTSHFAKGVREEIVELNLEHRISLHDFENISELLAKAYL